MKRHAMATCLLMAALGVCAQTQELDSLRVINLQEVEVISTRATSSTPVAFTNIGKEQLKKQNFGQDLPYLLSMTPSAITTSDAGAGVGYTTLRVRGTDGTRINVTANGIPINDAESHTVFWVNLPDFASSVKDMQVQRGAGTSTNGAGAFGASINMQTGDFSMKPYAEFNGSYGSFHTHKETVKVGTGLINNHWSFDARLSNISTDGYIDRASVGLNSYYLQGGYYNDNTSVKLITFAGKERTYHAWNYASKEEMERYGRRYNSCGFMYATDRDGHVYSKEYYKDDNGEKHYLTDEGGALHFYDDQTDNYTQKNYQLLFNHNFTSQWNLNIGLHYTKGDGYYQEYKGERSLAEYGMSPFEYNGGKIEVSDLIRKKAMDNWFGGGIFSVSYKADRLHASLGGALNRYDGDHFGKVLWVKNYIGELNPDHDYYRNNATKNDGNIYLKTNYELVSGLSAYLDLTLAVGDILKKNGIDVYYTRTTDEYETPFKKATDANNSGANLFVSIHRNSSENPNQYSGVETLVYSDTGLKAEVARNINNQLEDAGFKNLGVDERKNLVVLKRTKMPAVLVEAGFINNDKDNYLFDEEFDSIAQAIADGILESIPSGRPGNTTSNKSNRTDNNNNSNNNSNNNNSSNSQMNNIMHIAKLT